MYFTSGSPKKKKKTGNKNKVHHIFRGIKNGLRFLETDSWPWNGRRGSCEEIERIMIYKDLGKWDTGKKVGI